MNYSNNQSELFKQIDCIDFLDIGCSGSLSDKWSELFPWLSYTGFDPNAEECDRLNSQPHSYKSARYLPYAIAGEQGTQTMYLTESIYCYSLLHPNYKWLKRFSFFNLFKETGTASVNCTTLNALASVQNLKADIIKIDTQGLELPILKSGDGVLNNTFCVEVETGFVENYIGETTYAQIDEFMRSKGFLMFDMNIYKVSRNNFISNYGKHQPLWCETLWLFDYIGQGKKPTSEQAIKSLLICRYLNYSDYGVELLLYFENLNILNSNILTFFKKAENWKLKRKHPVSKAGKLLKLLPESINKRLMFGLQEIID